MNITLEPFSKGINRIPNRYVVFIMACLLTFAWCPFQAQSPHDTLLLNRYNKLCLKYEDESGDSLFKYANLQLNLALKVKSEKHIVHAYTNLGVANTRLFKFNDALTYFLKAREVIEKYYSTTSVSPLYGQIGYIYLRLERKAEAYKYFKMQQSVSILEKNYKSHLGSMVNLADYFNTQGQVDSTIAILNSALSISRQRHIRHFEVIILDNLANAYYSKALETEDKKLFIKVNQYADTALVLHYQDKDSSAIFYIYGLLGAVNMDMANYAKSEGYYKQYISYSQRTSDIFNLKIALDEFSTLYARQGKYNLAYKYRLRFDSINRLYLGEVAGKQVQELNTKYGTEKKEQQNMLLKKQNELSTETIKQQKIISYFIISALIISVIVAFFMYRIYSQKKKAHLLITRQKEEVDRKQIKIEEQKRVIEEKQKEILDSINYAKRIQYALLASDELLSENLSSSNHSLTAGYFVLFKPKDIVSGDFYWATEYNNKFYLAICDSTGHGVPGAFMSLLNIGFLSEAIREKNISQPHLILNDVRKRLIESISKDDQQDGMDGILLCIDKTANTITYAAANNSPILIRENVLIELPKDKMPVGKGQTADSFTLHTINLQKGDSLYLYTDGYPDQFGGPKGKKFMYKQLNHALSDISHEGPMRQLELLTQRFDAWKGELEQVDDVLIIGIRI
jgi:serine phosphatase RsbU (regulator of sigma subunit)